MNYKLIQERNLNYSPLEQVLYNRGIPIDSIDNYCNTSYLDILSPKLISNIEQGARMLIKHISQKDKTYIQVDADCDGYTSAAFLINYLHSLFPNYVENCVTWGLHEKKEHGIDLDFLPSDAKFIIVPDASSNEIALHKELSEHGIDILIIDHHEAEQVSPYACVINNQLDNYPNKTLSGVGMVYKFCCYIDSLLQIQKAENFIDLVAVGLTGDMMDVRQLETRELIRRGFNHITNPFIKGIIDKDQFHFQGEITQHKIAFYLVPLVNAVTRVGSLRDKDILFESMLEHRANILVPSTKRGEKGKEEKIITQALRMCGNVKKAQTNERDDNLKIVHQLIEEQDLLKHQILLVLLSPEYSANKNLTGLIANEIANEFQHPTLILNETEVEGKIHYAGSGRNFANSPLENFKDLLSDTQMIDYAEGHQSAFGFSIAADKVEEFIKITDEKLKDLVFEPTYFVDFIFRADDNYVSVIEDLTTREDLWGQNVAEPLIAFENIKVTKDKITLMAKDRNPTLKINISNVNNVSAIKFKSSEEEFNNLYSENGYIEINIVGTCTMNEWMGQYNPQILVQDYEIIKRQPFYF